MKVKLHCVYCDKQGVKVGEPGDVVEVSPTDADGLVRGGSAEVVEPQKKSVRD